MTTSASYHTVGVIGRPIEEVFAYLSDLRNELEWNPGARHINKLSDGPVGRGTRYEAEWRNAPRTEVTVTRYEPPKRWQTRSRSWGMDVTFTGSLDPQEEATRYVARLDVEATGLARFLLPLAIRSMKRQDQGHMRRIASSLGARHAVDETPPRVSFCCELRAGELHALLDDPTVLRALASLRASVSLALIELDELTAAAVRRLNIAGIPVTAWLVLDRRDGYYSTPDNADASAARYDAFTAWSGANDLSFIGVALDIEPPIQELHGVTGPHRHRVLRRWARRLFDRPRLDRAVRAYRKLLARIRADGYRTETYQFGFIVEEREAGSRVLQRAIGSMDLRADREWLMLYSSLLGDVGAGFLWNYAGSAYAPAVGDTGGTGPIPALSWDQFARDLRLARRWGDEITVYSLEGSVRQGFLARLGAFDWNMPPTEPPAARPMRIGQALLRAMLAVAEHPALALAAAVGMMRAAQRPRFALGWLAAATTYHRLVRQRLRAWGASASEAYAELPGDSVVRHARLEHTRATTIRASAAEVWPWLVQMGFGRGGYYYPGWLDALWGLAIRRRYRNAPWYTEQSVVNVNAASVLPELQNLAVGDRVKDGPDGYFEVRELTPGHALVLYTARHPVSGRPLDPADPRTEAFVECSWAFVLEPVDDSSTRLIVRTRGNYPPGPAASLAILIAFEPIDWLMQTVMLRGIRTRAEQSSTAPAGPRPGSTPGPS